MYHTIVKMLHEQNTSSALCVSKCQRIHSKLPNALCRFAIEIVGKTFVNYSGHVMPVLMPQLWVDQLPLIIVAISS